MAIARGEFTVSNLSDGATGRGIASIVEQFYLSTSKTELIGGTWSTTMPTWELGKYVWTRSLIMYTSGTPATETTTPLVSSEWEAANLAVPFIAGTQTGTTASWTGVAPFAALVDGQQITYWLPQTSATNVTLNLTLSGGGTTGAIACYYGGATRLTTHYPAGSSIRLIYRVNAQVGASQYTGWWADANYVDGNTYDRIRYNRNITAKSAIAAGYIVASDATDTFFHIAKDVPFSTDKPILYAASAIASAATGTNNYFSYTPAISVRTNSGNSGLTFTTYKSIYLKGVLDGLFFTPTDANLFVTDPVDDGSAYMIIGQLLNAYQYSLFSEHPIYAFSGGVLKLIAQAAQDVAAEAMNWIGDVDKKYDDVIYALATDDSISPLERANITTIIADITTDTSILVAKLGDNTTAATALSTASGNLLSFLQAASQEAGQNAINFNDLSALYSAYKTAVAAAENIILSAQVDKWSSIESGQWELGARIGSYEDRLRLEADKISMYINKGYGLEMAMQLAQDELGFYVDNQKRAWIGLDGLNAMQGTFAESLTIGNHKITKNGTDYTIIGWTGG